MNVEETKEEETKNEKSNEKAKDHLTSLLLNAMKKNVLKMTPTTEPLSSVQTTYWDYPGFECTYILKPSPFEFFASNKDSAENWGYCRGQWDGHFNERMIHPTSNPYGIVEGSGNRDKIREILCENLVERDTPLYQLFLQLLQSSTSKERILLVKKYLDDQNKTYNDESFWIQDESGGEPIKQSFPKAVIVPLIQQTSLYIHNKNKKRI